MFVYSASLVSLVAVLLHSLQGVQGAPHDPSAYLNRRDQSDLRDYRILTIGGGSARVEEHGDNLPSVTVPRKEKFPVDNVRKLPTDSKKLRKVQASVRQPADEEKRKIVKEAFKTSWNQYAEHAWGKDEIKPVSNQSADPFNGWAATMVDALDTLKIMGLDDEFDEAVEFVGSIDFTATFREDIPLFETLIRYLGGLISAYDLSGKEVLLDQAKVLADNLIGAFDTPNRMPITFYKWQDQDTKLNYLAGTGAGAAEIGTLSVEFIRLAQLTEDDRYYDAVDRITDQFIEFSKSKSLIKGLLPETMDISGCNVTYTRDDEDAKDDVVTLDDVRGGGNSNLTRRSTEVLESVLVPVDDEGEKFRRGHCKPQDMELTPDVDSFAYSYDGGIDSVYEYYVKTYQLLKGAEDKYKQLYLDIIEPTKEHLLFKPKVRNNDGILVLGSQIASKNGTMTPRYSTQHLTCFAGGMFALAGKLLDRQEDLELAERVTKGCVWAYNATNTGVMPDSYTVNACPGDDWDAECTFDEDDVQNVKRDDDEEEDAVYDQPPDMVSLGQNYYLRPEAIESVFYMWRVTGDEKWREYGWNMVESVLNVTAVRDDSGQIVGYSGVKDVTDNTGNKNNLADVEESFWMAETLKYSYLLFDDSESISLDDYVFNTEAHPLKLD
jgi:mannosyl-oligosaccharide alpha-1,2-mannosidase